MLLDIVTERMSNEKMEFQFTQRERRLLADHFYIGGEHQTDEQIARRIIRDHVNLEQSFGEPKELHKSLNYYISLRRRG